MQVRYFIIFLVVSLVGNKEDLYLEEEVTEEEGLELAKEIKAIYQRTSAKEESGGIDILFEKIVKRFLDLDIISIKEKKPMKEIKQNKLKRKKNACCS